MHLHKRIKVLVVGTTSDYIDWIRNECPGRALFLTAPEVRKSAREDVPSVEEEVLANLDDLDQVKRALENHMDHYDVAINGIVCFDCEYMELASVLASEFKLRYPELAAIQNCKDKLRSKQIWQDIGISCPRITPAGSLDDLIRFFKTVPDGIVLKPVFGTGSELVFKCRTEEEIKSSLKMIEVVF